MFLKALLTACAFLAAPLSLIAIEGFYRVSGWDPYENVSYSGSVVIKKTADHVFNAEWVLDDGERFNGTGIKSDDRVSFVFAREKTQKPLIGIQVYKIHNGHLKGTWVLLNQTKLGEEELKRQSSS